ncbi:DUF317 domain-containing protein [Streptomyces stelliscabiei]|uniref:DUF317 domain-containing protein n=1 Tax=Streptomyces stelliscabiei TaxID=146820 RepID=UPI003A8FEE2A
MHESQTLRIQLLHEADPREGAWTIAAYETPVSDRMWHLTLTANTPAGLLNSLLISLAHGEWDTSLDSPSPRRALPRSPAPSPTPAGHPRHKDAGCTGSPSKETPDSRSMPSPPGPERQPHFLDHLGRRQPDRPPGPSTHPLHPADLVADLTEELAHGIGTAGPALSNRRSTSARSAQHPASASPHTADTAIDADARARGRVESLSAAHHRRRRASPRELRTRRSELQPLPTGWLEHH